MGQQLKKVVKRKRLADRKKRKKEAVKLLKVGDKLAKKKVAKKAAV